jgi:hypothetical protein
MGQGRAEHNSIHIICLHLKLELVSGSLSPGLNKPPAVTSSASVDYNLTWLNKTASHQPETTTLLSHKIVDRRQLPRHHSAVAPIDVPLGWKLGGVIWFVGMDFSTEWQRTDAHLGGCELQSLADAHRGFDRTMHIRRVQHHLARRTRTLTFADIARGFVLATRIAKKVILCKGGNDFFVSSEKGIHSGVRKDFIRIKRGSIRKGRK